MRQNIIALNLVLFIFFMTIFLLRCNGKIENPKFTSEPFDDSVVQRLLEETNRFRKQNNLSKLTLNEQLAEAAMKHSKWMASKNRLSHVGNDLTGPDERIEREGYNWVACGENIACGQTTPEEAVSDWMSSKGHRANILGDFTEVGFGCDRNYWTAVYAKPKL